eukprot:GHUV01009663.1.p1 GENE.GHUV01009663.1~~GHUV01009663.1.p1  ORF type:complete len:491 (+),score=137.10 GHUV01009663.1:39-1475(+)
MVQALLVPTPTFLQLVNAVPGIKIRAWQATAAQLAAQHHHILGRHKQLAPLNMFFRSCTAERAYPGDVFEVPRTALLLTGQMQRYAPARGRSSPSLGTMSLTGAAAAAAAAGISEINGGSPVKGGSPVRGSSPSHGSYFGLTARSSSGSSVSGNDPPAPAAAAGAGGIGVSSSIGSVSAPGGSSNHSSAAAGALLWEDLGSPSVKLHSQSSSGAAKATTLVAPAELLPGDYLCVTEAVLLQVPWGPDIPTHQETASYQVHVLSKGSIHLGPRAGSGSGDLNDLAKLSSPLKGVLSRISRGLTRSSSDTVPTVSHLQTALDNMRQERSTARRSRTGFGSDSYNRNLQTLHEVPAEHDAVSRLKRCSVGSVTGGSPTGGTPTHAGKAAVARSLLGGAVATPAGAGGGGGHNAAGVGGAGDIEMGPTNDSPFAAGVAAEGGSGGERATAGAAVLPRATDVIGQPQPTGIIHSRSFKFSSLQ